MMRRAVAVAEPGLMWILKDKLCCAVPARTRPVCVSAAALQGGISQGKHYQQHQRARSHVPNHVMVWHTVRAREGSYVYPYGYDDLRSIYVPCLPLGVDLHRAHGLDSTTAALGAPWRNTEAGQGPLPEDKTLTAATGRYDEHRC